VRTFRPLEANPSLIIDDIKPDGTAAVFFLPQHVRAERAIDACLIAFIGLRVRPEPGDDLGIEPKRQLLLDGPIEQAAFGVGPVENLRRVRCIDGFVRQGRERFQLLPLHARQRFRSSLLHRAFLIYSGRFPATDDAADRLVAQGFGFRPSMNHEQQYRPDKPDGVQDRPNLTNSKRAFETMWTIDTNDTMEVSCQIRLSS
jgi:hypothetical protein